MRRFLGIEIGGTKLQIVLGDANATILERFRFAIDPSKGNEPILNVISQTLRRQKAVFKSIGVGFGGPIDHESGKVWTSHQVAGWTGFPLAQWLHQHANVPVFVDNDANVAALGEAVAGAGKDFSNVFYVTLGSGVGGGLVVNKKVYRGNIPGEAEFGHILLDKSGRTVESCCSGWAVDEKVRMSAKKSPDGALYQLTRNMMGGEARILAEAATSNDREAIRIMNEIADDLAFGLSHVVHLFHPESIVLGGGLSLTGERLRKLVEQKLTPYLMEAFRPGPSVRLASLGEDTVTVGALVMAVENSRNL